MTIKDIRAALVGGILLFNDQVLLTIATCRKCGDKVLIQGKNEDPSLALSAPATERLAATGAYEWRDELRFGPLCRYSGPLELKIVTPVSRKRRPQKEHV